MNRKSLTYFACALLTILGLVTYSHIHNQSPEIPEAAPIPLLEPETNPEDALIEFQKLDGQAFQYFQNEDYAKAAEIQTQAVHAASEYFPETHPRLLTAKHHLGRSLLNADQPLAALAVFQDVLDGSLTARNTEMLEANLRLAVSAAKKAETFPDFIIWADSNLLPRAIAQTENPAPEWKLLLGLASSCTDESMRGSATQYLDYAKALISVRDFHPNSEEQVQLYHLRSVQNAALGNENTARQDAAAAMEIAESAGIVTTGWQAVSLHENLVESFDLMLDHESSLKHSQLLIQAHESLEDSPRKLRSLSEAFQAHANKLFFLDRKRESLPWYEKAIAIDRTRTTAAIGPRTEALQEYALALAYVQQEEEAMRLMEEVLDARKKHYAPDSTWIASSYLNLGYIQYLIDHPDFGEEAYQNAISIYRKNPEFQKSLSTALNNLGASYLALGRPEDARQVLEEAIAIKTNFPSNPGNDAASYNLLGSAHRRLKNYKESEKYYMHGMALRERAYGRNHPKTAYIMRGLVRLYLATGRESEARHYIPYVGRAFYDSARRNEISEFEFRPKLDTPWLAEE